MRNSSNLLIYPDIEAAVKDGYKFYLSKNNVVLSDGLNGDGRLPAQYFKYVIDAKTMQPHDQDYPNPVP
jgi:2'-phosphotransferase